MTDLKPAYVLWMGNGPMIFRVPAQGLSYKFRAVTSDGPPVRVRNKVDGEAWALLRTGSCAPYLEKKLLRETSEPGDGDACEDVIVRKYSTPVRPEMPAGLGRAATGEEKRLREQNAKLQIRLAEVEARIEEGRRHEVGDDELEARMPPAAEAPPIPSVTDLTVPKLTAAIKGMTSDRLELVLSRERAAKRRSGAIDAIETEQLLAMEREG